MESLPCLAVASFISARILPLATCLLSPSHTASPAHNLGDRRREQLHARAAWRYALSAGKEHGSDATFDAFEEAEFQLDAPLTLGPLLRRKFAVLTSRVVEQQTSEDGTIKLLVRLQDGQMVETVIISHGGKHPRTTLCVSSQVGCQMACTFCATGTMGLKGDLTAGEILEQVLHASRVSPIRNVVFMGMGEPLNNYDAVLASIRGMSDGRMFKLSPKHITLSTVGVVPRMKQLTIDAPETQLALSLHAPNQELRNRIVPSARAYKLDTLIEALDGHLRGPEASSKQQILPGASPPNAEGTAREDTVGGDDGTAGASEDGDERIAGVMFGGKGAGRRALIEYVMLAGVNDTEDCAQQLGELLKGRNVVVNLIPYNPTYATGSEEFQEPTEEALQAFKAIVHSHDLLVTIRRHHGRDIDGACGQLAIKTVGSGSTGGVGDGGSGGPCGNSGGKLQNDIEDLVSGSSGGRPKKPRAHDARKKRRRNDMSAESRLLGTETPGNAARGKRDGGGNDGLGWAMTLAAIVAVCGMGALVYFRVRRLAAA